ncbi:hypothetical protein PENTCL1PPCAC_14421 [Pristionchus entomophagus]|uniref:Tryptophan synthase beta chain-like PALP domain-containing protein n=1 Tax=Pristionchus entomophagus TaxID=358040 RepID=A0AAV5T9J3_9BILA|nr:hypothetical protein PENTCL1PPCAC_14421 [Pristionchus entomophagus]
MFFITFKMIWADMSTLPNPAAAIGNTPLVELRNIGKGLSAKIGVQLEYMNPSGSVKDRAAWNMVEAAETKGLIFPGKTILVEATSGNLGISLAMVAQIKGYKCLLLMPAGASLERRALMLAYGAELILVHPDTTGFEMAQTAKQVAESHPDFFWTNQFGNPDNVDAHVKTTGPEIYEQTQGKVDIVCFGAGSFGTVMGTAKFLKSVKPQCKVFVVEPDECAFLSRGETGKHSIAGIGPGFVTDNVDRSLMDGVITVKSADAVAMAGRLAKEEAILAGISSGANIIAALELAARPENAGKLIVTSINSNGERYLSSILYKDLKASADGMTYQSLEESIADAHKLLG